METTEKIVEAYCRYVQGWFTIPNIKCDGQREIDILAVDPSRRTNVKRYHIECGISISGSFSKLTGKEFSLEKLRQRVGQAEQRRTVGYFIQQKFRRTEVLAEIARYGFTEGNYDRVIVTWGWTDEAEAIARHQRIELWDFRNVLKEIADTCHGKRTYFTDDTLRTIQLFLRSGVILET